jgi:uncharacterized membrane protein (UPF0127 family)
MRRVVLLCVGVALLGAQGASAALERGRAVIDVGDRVVKLEVEIARSPEDQSVGLMFRRSLPPNAGMAFVFPSDTDGGFWMKNTRIPLSIAFVDRRGVIRRILDMTPCRRDPCRVYYPNATYRIALEVNRGAFGRLGVEVGDRLRLRRA